MPTTLIAGKPMSSSHMRVGSTSTGALRIGGVENLPILRAPVPRPVDPLPRAHTPLRSEAPPITALSAHQIADILLAPHAEQAAGVAAEDGGLVGVRQRALDDLREDVADAPADG